MAYKRIDWDREEKSLKKLVKEEEKARIKFKNRQMNEQLFEDNAEKFFFPLTNTINSGNEKYINESKEIQNELHELSNKFNNALSYYPEIESPIKVITFNNKFQEEDRKNLAEMDLVLPDSIQDNKDLLDKMVTDTVTWNRRVGQHLGKKGRKSEDEKEKYRSYETTLAKYDEVLKLIKGGREYVDLQRKGEGIKRKKLVQQKRAPGRPRVQPIPIMYKSSQELAEKLAENIAAKEAGHTGVDDYIIAILDELLNIKEISKLEFDQFYKIYFPSYIK